MKEDNNRPKVILDNGVIDKKYMRTTKNIIKMTIAIQIILMILGTIRTAV